MTFSGLARPLKFPMKEYKDMSPERMERGWRDWVLPASEPERPD